MPYLCAGGHRLEYKWIRPHPDRHRAGEQTPALVFLHEGLGSMALWKDFPERVVAATGCPALVYSRHGYGKSDRLTAPRAVDYMHREALEVLPEVLACLSIDRPILIGHSDGASIALIYTGVRTVRALVLIAPHVFVEEVTVANIRKTRDAFETTDMRAKLARYHADPPGAFWGWNNIWLDAQFRRWNIKDCLPGIRCPVLLLQCEDDPYGSMAQLDAIEHQVGGPVERCILDEGAHSPHLRQKQKTVRAVARFIRQTRERF